MDWSLPAHSTVHRSCIVSVSWDQPSDSPDSLTHGEHRFFEEEAIEIRDARRVPIKFAGYALSHCAGHVCVRIERVEYLQLKAWFLDLACRRGLEGLAPVFRGIRFVPYAPVRQQLLCVWRAVGRARRLAGYDSLPIDCVPWRRKIVKPFSESRGVQSGIP